MVTKFHFVTTSSFNGNGSLVSSRARFLEKELGKKKIDKLLESWKTFEYTQRKAGEDVKTFISRFEMEYARVKAAWAFKPGYKMPEAIIASMLLMRVKASETQEMIIRSKVDLEKEEVVLEVVELVWEGLNRSSRVKIASGQLK